ncbi:pyruvate kinase [Nitrincola sp. MINF-07-Sa-05]|uniref:pyruvate kinase n=1 Tax=Nitrincola salilacus TaxID=3400273 RepID=UPI003918268B
MLRRTKIVATLGPSSSTLDSIEKLVLAGADVMRLNFSHGEADEHRQRARLVREVSARHGRYVALLGDLQGPKIRIARFADKKVTLKKGQIFTLDSGLDKDAGTVERVGIDYEALVNDSRPGDILLLDDGRLELEVQSVEGDRVITRVVIGGELSNNKGINRKGGGLSAKALTDKDKEDIKLAAEIGVDYVAVSFPRDASDMHEARALLEATGSTAGLVAKIERAETVADDEILDDVIRASEVVMVARGDLAVEIGDATLVGVQKHIIARARALNKIVITATQMMESMINSPMPTRAEVSDVANAVMDYTDAVMLSAETAAGDYPTEAVEAMARIIIGAELHPITHKSRHRIYEEFQQIDEAIALSAMYAANHLQGVKAIICMSETGLTPRLMSRIRSPLPIYEMSRRVDTQHRVALYRGVQTIPFYADQLPPEEINQRAVDELIKRDALQEGDRVIITKGDYLNAQGGTNTMKIFTIGERIALNAG